MAIRLLEFKFCGIKNIEKEVDIHFFNEYASKKSLEEESHIKALYGPNGSGKTASCYALHYYREIVLNHRFLATNDAKTFRSLINDKIHRFTVEATFYLSFKDGKKGRKFRHIIEVYDNGRQLEISKEELYQLGARYELSPLYKYDSINGFTYRYQHKYFEWEPRDILASIPILIIEKNLDEVNKTDNKILPFFAPVLFCGALLVEFCEKRESPLFYSTYDQEDVATVRKRTDQFTTYDFAGYFNYDEIIHIDDKEAYENRLLSLTEFVRKMKPNLKEIKPQYNEINNEFNGVYLTFCYEGDTKVGYKFESSGIKKIVKLFDIFRQANKHKVVVIDEIDADIHDVFLSNLIDYYVRYTKAQIFITTHNVDLMTNIKALKHSIDFLSQDNVLTSWVVNGKSSPKKKYLNGMVSHIPFNLFSSDFIEIFNIED